MSNDTDTTKLTVDDWENAFSTEGLRTDDDVMHCLTEVGAVNRHNDLPTLVIAVENPDQLQQAAVYGAIILQGPELPRLRSVANTDRLAASILNQAMYQYHATGTLKSLLVAGVAGAKVGGKQDKKRQIAALTKAVEWFEENKTPLPVPMIITNSAGDALVGTDLLWPENKQELGTSHAAMWDYYLASNSTEQTLDRLKSTCWSAFQAKTGYFMDLGPLFVCISMPHIKRTRGENGNWQFHSVDGPAVVWGDKVERYFWRDLEVEKNIIMDPNIDPKLAFTHENMEVRRVLAERLGYEKILKQCNVKEIARDRFGRLLITDQFNDDGGKPAMFVHVKCSTTERNYYLRVPPDTATPQEGIAATFGVDLATYNPVVET